MDNISLSSDVVFTLWNTIPVTNSVLTAVLTSVVIIIMAIVIRLGAGIMPSKMQVAIEMIFGYFYDQMRAAYANEKRVKLLFPFFLTIFLFLIVINQFSILPILGQLTAENAQGDTISIFRTSTTDFSLPIAMALFVVLASQVWAFTLHPIRHLSNYFRIQELFKIRKLGDIPFAFIEMALGLLDIIGEIAKVISLSARLFGNIFAGEVMYMVMVGLVAYIAPMPFVILSIFSGFVQAFVFAFLALQFMSITLDGVKTDKQREEEQKALQQLPQIV